MGGVAPGLITCPGWCWGSKPAQRRSLGHQREKQHLGRGWQFEVSCCQCLAHLRAGQHCRQGFQQSRRPTLRWPPCQLWRGLPTFMCSEWVWATAGQQLCGAMPSAGEGPQGLPRSRRGRERRLSAGTAKAPLGQAPLVAPQPPRRGYPPRRGSRSSLSLRRF